MAKPGQDILDTVVNMFRKDDGKQHVFTAETVQTAALSMSAFYKACTHPYVIDKTKKYVYIVSDPSPVYICHDF